MVGINRSKLIFYIYVAGAILHKCIKTLELRAEQVRARVVKNNIANVEWQYSRIG